MNESQNMEEIKSLERIEKIKQDKIKSKLIDALFCIPYIIIIYMATFIMKNNDIGFSFYTWKMLIV